MAGTSSSAYRPIEAPSTEAADVPFRMSQNGHLTREDFFRLYQRMYVHIIHKPAVVQLLFDPDLHRFGLDWAKTIEAGEGAVKVCGGGAERRGLWSGRWCASFASVPAAVVPLPPSPKEWTTGQNADTSSLRHCVPPVKV